MANDSIQAPKMPEQNKAKKGRNLQSQKKLGRAFCKFSFSQSPSRETVIKLSPQKNRRQVRKSQQNPAINLQKWITKTAKKLTERQNKTSSAAKSTASYLQKS